MISHGRHALKLIIHCGFTLRTLKCLNIGTPKTINFPFVPNGKLMIFSVPVFEHIIIRLHCAQTLGHLNIINFTFRTNGNFIPFRFPNT